MTADISQAAPCPVPSRSSSRARPRQAFPKHPRLTPAAAREDKKRFEWARAAQADRLEGESGAVIVEAKDGRTTDAQRARDAARIEGRIPPAAATWPDVQDLAVVAQKARALTAARDRATEACICDAVAQLHRDLPTSSSRSSRSFRGARSEGATLANTWDQDEASRLAALA